MHEYALHLMRFHYQRFGRHPRFRYFILNLMMCHRSQGIEMIFLKKNAKENIPTTIENLHTHLKNLPDEQLVEQLMHFISSMRGTRPYWNKCHVELSNMINQIGSPTIFFTLSATNTKWLDLQLLLTKDIRLTMQSNKNCIDNIINNPYTTSLYLHQRFTIFRQEVIEKLLHTKEYWHRYDWKHCGTTHVHGFLWLENAPDMDKLDWENNLEVERARFFLTNMYNCLEPSYHISNQQHNTSITT